MIILNIVTNAENNLIMSSKRLIHITGPTSSGKTKLAINLASKLKTEIISYDSRQFYKEMKIGTGVPSKVELSKCKHHFIHNKSILEHYNVGKYFIDANNLLKKLFKNFKNIILVGGSGLYADSLIYGLDEFPEVKSDVRNKLINDYNKKGLDFLQNLLKKKDPKYYKIVDINNKQRVIRALEIIISSNKPFSSFLGKKQPGFNYNIITINIEIDRKELYRKINNRVDKMILDGLEDEVKKLSKHQKLNAMQTVGYKEWFGYWNNLYDLNNTIELIKKNTRRYAKRQITWNKKYTNQIKYKHNSKRINYLLKQIQDFED